MKCANCHFENPPDLLYCGKCGTRLSSPEVTSTIPTKTYQIPLKQLARGSTFAGRFEIIEEIGMGGMGAVYRVVDKQIDEEIALKLLKPEIAADKKTIERFKNELKLARRITHKNVCRMYDLSQEEGTPYITMEYVSGEDLKSLIRRAGQLSAARAISLAKQVGEGLMEAHRLGVVHRDLKSQNIMIDREGGVHIMDFGIARMLSASQFTEEGVIIGTPHYMSPEQAEGRAADQRADIYALGVIIYEMVTGRVPFDGDSALSIALKHKSETPKIPKELSVQIPQSLSRLILKCLEKDREQRYQSAEELLVELTGIEKEITAAKEIAVERKLDTRALDERELLKSIAVLPFKDMSPQQDQAYFCEGLAEELINALTQVKDMKVAARTSSFSFKGKEADIREIGKTLNVGSVLEGSVQKAGNRLRITAQLIKVSDGYHLWSERFDRDIQDIFAIQDEISLAVVDKLKGELLEEDKARITKRHTENKDAYSLYLKGLYFWNRRYHGDMIRAVGFYQKAINKDPNYAHPYVGIANVFNIMGQWGFIPPKDAYTKSKAMLQRALEIDDTLSELYSSLGFMTAGYEWDFEAADKYLCRSIELNPRNTFAHGWRAENLALRQKYEEAAAEVKEAIQSDPLWALIHSLLGVVQAIAGQVETGREQILKSIAMDPDQPMPYLFLGMTYLAKPAIPEKAVQYLQKAIDFGLIFAYGWLGAAYAAAGRKAEALSILEKLDKMEKERYLPLLKKSLMFLKPEFRHFRFMKKKYISPLLRAMVWMGLNEQDMALEYLEKSCEARDYFFPAVMTLALPLDLPWIEELKTQPRFKALQEKVKIR